MPTATTSRSGAPARPRRGRSTRSRTLLTAATFLAPAIVAVVALRLWPVAQSVVASLRTTPLGVAPTEWAGLDQFARLFSDPAYLNTLKVTAIFGLIINPLQIAAALAIAVLLNERIKGVGLARTLIFLPVAVPQSVSAVIWSIAFRPDGLSNALLARLGLPAQPWLTSTAQALPAIMIMLSWIGVGYWMMFLIAGLKEISPSLYEAAALDGAGRWNRFVHITVPQLRRQIAFVLVADTISNLLVFAPVQILTDGGPQGSTSLIMYDAFQRAYVAGDLGQAGAATVVLVALALLIVAVQFRLLSPGKD